MNKAPQLLTLALALAGTVGAQTNGDRGLLSNTDGAFQGYTLISPLLSNDVLLLDMNGEVAHTWKTEHAPGNSVYLLDNGHLLRCGRVEDNPIFHGGGIGGRVQELDWDGNVLWDFTLSTEQQMHHHDIEPMPNGNILMIAWEYMFEEDAEAMGRDPELVGDQGWWPDSVLEVKPIYPDGGEIVWEWHAWDHLVQDADEEGIGYGSVPELPGLIDVNADHRDQPPMTERERKEHEEMLEKMRALGYVGGDEDEDDAPPARRGGGSDWMHTNSIDYHAGHDLILLSSPRLNEILVIDHSTSTDQAATNSGGRRGRGGEILYRWGNPRNYGAGQDTDQRLFAQHDAQWIDEGLPGAGNILIFNNGGGRTGEGQEGDFSSVDEIVPPFDAESGFDSRAGQPFGPSEPTWAYVAPEPTDFHSFFISGCQRLPNGNTLICSGAQGRVFEVTPAGAIVWEYLNEHGGEVKPSFGHAAGGGGGGGIDPKALFRATRIAPDHPGLAGRL